MFLAKVVGTVWSTKKTPDLEGVKFRIVHPYDLDKEPTRNIVVVADRLGAGTGEMVMCAYGKAARTAIGNQDMKMSTLAYLCFIQVRRRERKLVARSRRSNCFRAPTS